jgi:hypothetical protein
MRTTRQKFINFLKKKVHQRSEESVANHRLLQLSYIIFEVSYISLSRGSNTKMRRAQCEKSKDSN